MDSTSDVGNSSVGFQTPEARLKRLEDIEEIRRLRAIYSGYVDGGWEPQGPSHMGPMSGLYVEEGVWDGRPAAPLAEGRDAIHEIIAIGSRPIPFIMHYVTNSLIDIAADGETATGKWHVIAPFIKPDGSSHWLLGTYDENYVRTDQGWRFLSTRFTPSRTSAQASGWQSDMSDVHD